MRTKDSVWPQSGVPLGVRLFVEVRYHGQTGWMDGLSRAQTDKPTQASCFSYFRESAGVTVYDSCSVPFGFGQLVV